MSWRDFSRTNRSGPRLLNRRDEVHDPGFGLDLLDVIFLGLTGLRQADPVDAANDRAFDHRDCRYEREDRAVTEPDQKKDINYRLTPAIPPSAQGQEGIRPPERPARRRSPI